MTSDPTAPDPTAPVLITGGTGFVGRALVEQLQRAGLPVITLDVAPSALDPSPRRTDLQGDVRDAELIDRLVSGCRMVVHLAAIVGVDEYVRRPDDIIDVIVTGARNVLRSAARHGRPVLLASTSEVYGCNMEDLHEASRSVFGPPSVPRWSYAISKSTAEHLAFAEARRGLPVVITRFFNVYGPHLDRPGSGRVVSRFLGRIQDGLPLELVDGGHAIRSFCYVDDAVAGTMRLLEALLDPARRDRVAGRAFNIGRRESVTMAELARRMAVLSGHDAGVIDVPGEEHFGLGFEDTLRRVPIVEAIAEAVDFRAHIDLDTGLRRTLDHWGLLAPDALAAPPPPLVHAVHPRLAPDRPLSERLHGVLLGRQLSNRGPRARGFEARLAETLQAEAAVAVSSGSAALLLAARALGVRGAAVLPSFTFLATASAAVHAGLTPVFCDIDPQTWTMDPAHLERILDSRDDVGLVMPVTAFGVPPDLPRIGVLAAQAGAAVLHDGCHAFGSTLGGLPVLGTPGVHALSLHATKILNAVEGGVLLTDDRRLADEVRRLANYGFGPASRRDATPGFNFHFDELHAEIGHFSLDRAPAVLARRREQAGRIRAAAAPFQPQHIPPHVDSNFQEVAVCFPRADEVGIEAVQGALLAGGVEGRRYFHPALHDIDVFAAGAPPLPITEQVVRRNLCLPMHSHMPEASVEQVVAALGALAQGSLA